MGFLILSLTLTSQSALFADQTSNAGLDALGSGRGIMIADYDADGDDDVFVPGGGQSNKLLRNDGNGSFENVIATSGISADGFTYCAVWGDIDNDNDLDLFVGNLGSSNFTWTNRLYANQGDGTFIDITAQAGVATLDMTRSVMMTDINGNGYNDIYVCNMNSQNVLWSNNGDGTFTNTITASGAVDVQVAMTSIFFDPDNDGDQDLYLIHDANQQFIFYQNDGSGHFSDASQQVGLDQIGQGMGVDCADIDNDGWLDVYVTNLGPNFFFHNNGDGTFTERAEEAGIDDVGMGWGCFFIDFDNDGLKDLYVINDYGFAPVVNALFRNLGDGTFENVSDSLLESPYQGYGGSWMDIDEDGYQDIILANLNQPSNQLFLNNDSSAHWLEIDCHGTQSPTDAYGTRVQVHIGDSILIDEKKSTVSYSSQGPSRLHFGLGSQHQIDSVLVIFPTGITNVILSPEVDKRYTVIENDSTYVVDCNPAFSYSLSPLSCSLFEIEVADDLINEWHVEGQNVDLLSDSTLQFESVGANQICIVGQNSCTAESICTQVQVDDLQVDVLFEYNISDLELQLTSTSANADSISWFISDGSTYNEQELTHLFETEGEYEVCLIVSNQCSESTLCDTVIVDCPIPTVDWTLNIDSTTILLSYTGSISDSLLWELGDGTVSNDQELTHDYVESGDYELCLTAYNPCGVSTVCDSLTIETSVVDQLSEISGIQLSYSPNPFKDFIHISTQTRLDYLTLMELTGRIVPVDTRKVNDGYILSTHGPLQQGAYLLIVKSDFGIHQQIVIQE